MVGWVLWFAVLTVVSYLADAGVLSALQDVRVPMLDASVLSVLLLISTLGLLYRIQGKRKTGEKERLASRIRELEEQLAARQAQTP